MRWIVCRPRSITAAYYYQSPTGRITPPYIHTQRRPRFRSAWAVCGDWCQISCGYKIRKFSKRKSNLQCHSRSLILTLFDKPHMITYYKSSTVTVLLSCHDLYCFQDTATYLAMTTTVLWPFGKPIQKIHSPTHTHPDQQPSFISFLHLFWSLFNLYGSQTFCTTSLQVFFCLSLGLEPSTHTPYISSPNHCLLFTKYAHTIATCFAVVPRLCHLTLFSTSTLNLELHLLP